MTKHSFFKVLSCILLCIAFPLSSELIKYHSRESTPIGQPHPRIGKEITLKKIDDWNATFTINEEDDTCEGSVDVTYTLETEGEQCRITEHLELTGRIDPNFKGRFIGEFKATNSLEEGECIDLLPQEKGTWEGIASIYQGEETIALFYKWKGDAKGSLGRLWRADTVLLSDPESFPILRTLVYQQLTKWRQDKIINPNPLLSKDGHTILFSLRGTPTGVYTINFDGSNLRQIDSYTRNHRPLLALSEDGRNAITSNGWVIRYASILGNNTHELIAFEHSNITAITIKRDRVYFILKNNTALKRKKARLERGVYSIRLDGTDLKKLVGPRDVAQVLGIDLEDINDIPSFGENSSSLAVSEDGETVVFVVRNKGWGNIISGKRIFSLTRDGLRQLIGPTKSTSSVGISGNGEVVGYTIVPINGPIEGGIIYSDGKNRRTLVTNPPIRFVDGNTRNEAIQLNDDGSLLLFGTSSMLFNTDDGTVTQLGTGGGRNASYHDELYRLRMNGDATRFLFLLRGPQGVLQLATLQVNPRDIGLAPTISHPFVEDHIIAISDRRFTTIQGEVHCNDTLLSVSNQVYYKGLPDKTVRSGLVMFDDGKQRGDQAADDGIYTHNGLNASLDAVTGPRTIRIKAEGRTSDNRHHCMAIEFGNIVVVEEEQN